MLLSPSLAFAKKSQEIWIEQVQEIYPIGSRRRAQPTVKKEPRRQTVQQLRAMQAQSFACFVRDQWASLLEVLSLPVRVLAHS